MKKGIKYVRRSFFWIVFLLLFMLIAFIGIAANRVNNQDSLDIVTKAQEEDPNYCQNNCTPDKNACTVQNPFESEDPGCCKRIQQTGDPTECSWPQRGWCFPEECSTIPEGVNRERCGGPRSVYCERCQAKGCFQPTAIPTAIPTKYPTPTSVIITTPANTPRITPTSPPISNVPKPSTILIIPTAAPPSKIPSVQLPELSIPKTGINLIQTNKAVRKPLGLFEYLFKNIRTIDKQLEEIINIQIKKILDFRL